MFVISISRTNGNLNLPAEKIITYHDRIRVWENRKDRISQLYNCGSFVKCIQTADKKSTPYHCDVTSCVNNSYRAWRSYSTYISYFIERFRAAFILMSHLKRTLYYYKSITWESTVIQINVLKKTPITILNYFNIYIKQCMQLASCCRTLCITNEVYSSNRNSLDAISRMDIDALMYVNYWRGGESIGFLLKCLRYY